jgi:glycosyltransferase involved in cell wall biosynthesis
MMSKQIIIATDAWEPQLNGVARTLKQTAYCLSQMGHRVQVIQPGLFRSVPCPFSSDVRLALGIKSKYLEDIIQRPCAVHISTEGPIGLAVRRYCIKNKIPFTTAYHTKFPEFLKKCVHVPLWMTRSYLRWFHRPSEAIMATTPSLMSSVESMKIKSDVKLWTRGVDFGLFHPRPKNIATSKPVGIYVGRISKEKSIEDFLSLDLDIEKIVVGDGPILNDLKRKYPQAIFTGPLRGEELAQMYCNADVFVFPSKSDTFGLVVLESIACGVPVACYPVEGPGEIIGDGQNPGIGKASWDLKEAVEYCLKIKSVQDCLTFAKKHSWEACTDQFFNNLIFAD